MILLIMNLLISMPGGTEWVLLLLLILLVLPFICYRLGYRAGKRDGELQELRRNQGRQ